MGDTAKKWANPTLQLQMQYWFYDVENPIDVYMNGSVPRVSLKGPYGFRLVVMSYIGVEHRYFIVKYFFRKRFGVRQKKVGR